MNALAKIPVAYKDAVSPVEWQGRAFADDATFNTFMSTDVAARLHDTQGQAEFETHLKGLALTGFGNATLDKVLKSDTTEEREWAVGEALAEAWVASEHGVIWPWNMARDKRNPNASLPGADLIGFHQNGSDVRLVLGEVKTSSEDKAPPQVMTGRSGMIHQIDGIANDLPIIKTLLAWLLTKCKKTKYEDLYNKAVEAYLNSGTKAVTLFGVLIRGTSPNEMDLKNRGKALAKITSLPTMCHLIALYLPCSPNDLFDKTITSGASS